MQRNPAQLAGEATLIDLTETLRTLQVSQSKGPLESCQRAVEVLVHDLGAWTDWDDLSDEFWARLLIEREVVAVVCVYDRIIFGVGDRDVTEPPGFAIFRVPGLDAECLCADQAMLVEKFGDRGRESEIHAEMFALSDLWAVSV